MLTLTNNSGLNPGVRRRTLRQEIEFGAVSLTFVVILLALVVSLIYLAHANRIATRGYVIKRLEVEKTQSVTQNEIWHQQVSTAKSLAVIQASEKVASMVHVRNANYVRTDLTMAKK